MGPVRGTGRDQEESTADGLTDLGNFPLFRRPMTQWYMRITAYADRLLADLVRLDCYDSIKQMQQQQGANFGVTLANRNVVFGLTTILSSPINLQLNEERGGIIPAKYQRA